MRRPKALILRALSFRSLLCTAVLLLLAISASALPATAAYRLPAGPLCGPTAGYRQLSIQHRRLQRARRSSPRNQRAIHRASRTIRRLQRNLACSDPSVQGPSLMAESEEPPERAWDGEGEFGAPDEFGAAGESGAAGELADEAEAPLEGPAATDVSATTPGEPTAPPGAGSLSISVSGNHLVDAAGDVVTLHGVNFSGTMWKCLGGRAFANPTDQRSLEALVSWHVNAVRIPMNEDCWLGINGAPTDVEAYRAELKRGIDALNSLGMYVILDLHWSAPGSILSHLGLGFEGEFEMADADHAASFWESVASYFADDHGLLFDLFNEPFGISWPCLREGCWAPRGYEAAGMQQLVDAVRRTGATQPLLVSGLNWASVAGREWLRYRPEDPANQLVASIHAYGVMGNYGPNIGVVSEQVPVVLSEIGEKDCAHGALDNLLPWADRNGVSYLAWAWYTGNCWRGPALISDYGGTPTPYGVGFREHLLSSFPAPSPAG